MRRATVRSIVAVAFAVATCLGLAVPAVAQGIGFNLEERQIIAEFYGGEAGTSVGKGKGKDKDKKNKGRGVGNQGMPPGLAKKGKLPPGIAKRQLPPALVAQLPPPPKGFERVIVENDILLVDIATQVIHDAITDVWR